MMKSMKRVNYSQHFVLIFLRGCALSFYFWYAAISKHSQLSETCPHHFPHLPRSNGAIRRVLNGEVPAQGHLCKWYLRRCSGSGCPKTETDKICSSCHKVCGGARVKWSEHQDLYVDVYPVPRLDLGKTFLNIVWAPQYFEGRTFACYIFLAFRLARRAWIVGPSRRTTTTLNTSTSPSKADFLSLLGVMWSCHVFWWGGVARYA